MTGLLGQPAGYLKALGQKSDTTRIDHLKRSHGGLRHAYVGLNV